MISSQLAYCMVIYTAWSPQSRVLPLPPNAPRRAMPNCTECFPGYDMSSDCSTCVGAESIQCVEGQQNCSVSVTYSV